MLKAKSLGRNEGKQRQKQILMANSLQNSAAVETSKENDQRGQKRCGSEIRNSRIFQYVGNELLRYLWTIVEFFFDFRNAFIYQVVTDM